MFMISAQNLRQSSKLRSITVLARASMHDKPRNSIAGNIPLRPTCFMSWYAQAATPNCTAGTNYSCDSSPTMTIQSRVVRGDCCCTSQAHIPTFSLSETRKKGKMMPTRPHFDTVKVCGQTYLL